MHPTSEEIKYRFKHLQESHQRFEPHQQLHSLSSTRNRSALNFSYRRADPPSNTLLQSAHSVLPNTVSRTLNVYPTTSYTRETSHSYVGQARSAATDPYLSNPPLRTQFTTAYYPALLSDKARIAEVAPQPVEHANSHSKDAKWVRIIQQCRRQKEERQRRTEREEEKDPAPCGGHAGRSGRSPHQRSTNRQKRQSEKRRSATMTRTTVTVTLTSLSSQGHCPKCL